MVTPNRLFRDQLQKLITSTRVNILGNLFVFPVGFTYVSHVNKVFSLKMGLSNTLLTADGLQKRSVFDQHLKRILTLMPKFKLYQILTVCISNQNLAYDTLINKIEVV